MGDAVTLCEAVQDPDTVHVDVAVRETVHEEDVDRVSDLETDLEEVKDGIGVGESENVGDTETVGDTVKVGVPVQVGDPVNVDVGLTRDTVTVAEVVKEAVKVGDLVPEGETLNEDDAVSALPKVGDAEIVTVTVALPLAVTDTDRELLCDAVTVAVLVRLDPTLGVTEIVGEEVEDDDGSGKSAPLSTSRAGGKWRGVVVPSPSCVHNNNRIFSHSAPHIQKQPFENKRLATGRCGEALQPSSAQQSVKQFKACLSVVIQTPTPNATGSHECACEQLAC